MPAADASRLAWMLSDTANASLEGIAREAQRETVRRFGREIQLFAPLYLSSECANVCLYCGFSAPNAMARRTLSFDQIDREAAELARRGFRQILLVSGEHARHVPVAYLEEAVRVVHKRVPSVSVEVAPLETPEYARLTAAGADGLIVYQETYDRGAYAELHPKGAKRDFEWRFGALDRGAAAGMRFLGLGVLLGLTPLWRQDVLALVAHARRLARSAWRCQISVALPRMRPAVGAMAPRADLSDRDYARALCALRLALPDAHITLSTRESAALRDGLARICVTRMSAGSSTEPGGYADPSPHGDRQFEIEDARSPAEVAAVLRASGIDPVWKDWEEVLHGAIDA